MFEHENPYGYCTSKREIRREMRDRLHLGEEWRGEGYLVEGAMWKLLKGSRVLSNLLDAPTILFRVGYVVDMTHPNKYVPGVMYYIDETEEQRAIPSAFREVENP